MFNEMETWHQILQTCCTAFCGGRNEDGTCPFRKRKHRKGECPVIQEYIDGHDLHAQLHAEECAVDYDEDPLGWLDWNS